MPPERPALRRALRAVGAVGGVGLASLAYAGLIEVNAFRLRRVTVPVLPTGATSLRVLHISDLHLGPWDSRRQRWVSELAALEPDLVVDTGDNLASPRAISYVTGSLGRLLQRPGVYVWGSNDYYAPTFKNPLTYLTRPSRQGQPQPRTLPWRSLGEEFAAAGWHDLTHRRLILEIEGVRLGFRGTDDGHLRQDRYADVAGPVDRTEMDVAIGVTHSPYRRILDAMTADGLDLILAGHTHGGQVCVPGWGALVTNCDLDTRRVKGLSAHHAGGRTAQLHVSGGLGTSPYARIRFACPPEATLLTLVERP